MSAKLEILNRGMMATVQDRGRFGYQSQGITAAGAMDLDALRIANTLVGNTPFQGALEFSYFAPEFKVLDAPVRFALVGDMSAKIFPGGGDEFYEVKGRQTFSMQPGDLFKPGPLNNRVYGYLAVEGGIEVPEFLGSQSTYARSKLGGFEGRALLEGDLLPVSPSNQTDTQDLAVRALPDWDRALPIRVIFGPQDDYFSNEEKDKFLSQAYSVSRQVDRMGMRLEGEALEHIVGADIASDGIAIGSIQVPANGLPIILLSDHQTAGGYSKIATVISADLPRLAHMKTGNSFSFQSVNVEEAEEALRNAEKALATLLETISPMTPDANQIAAKLYKTNLVSGVLNATNPFVDEQP
jgi:biotin-dependent carboxylase-like uncharacterized protein